MKNPTKILIVDDEAYIRRVLELKLKNKGYEVITAVNGAEGIEKFNLYHPDVVITDIKMPEMDGQALCEKIKKSNNDKPYLIIVITCSVSEGDISWINNMRDMLLLEKPFSPRETFFTAWVNVLGSRLVSRRSSVSFSLTKLAMMAASNAGSFWGKRFFRRLSATSKGWSMRR